MKRKNLWGIIRDGQEYISEWPIRKELNLIFPENRVIKATQFAIKVMPAVAVISVLLQITFHNYSAFPQALFIALFALSLPIQGLCWLGIRRETQLPPALAVWYKELHGKVVTEGGVLVPVKSKPKYKELAHILNRAFKQLDKSILERWF